jgi:hypothetical protein
MQQLARREVVRVYAPPVVEGGGTGTLGLLLTDVPRERVWIAVRDAHLSVTEGLVERRLGPARPVESEVWFGLMRLPVPFNPRYWRIEVQNDLRAASASKGKVWERTWNLVDGGATLLLADHEEGRLPGVAQEDLIEGIYLPENHGSWLVVDVGGGFTLLGYRATSRVGGVIPDSLIREFAMFQLQDLLTGVEAQAKSAHEHYREGHEPLHGGDGKRLRPFTP